jgi:hypothetical protein
MQLKGKKPPEKETNVEDIVRQYEEMKINSETVLQNSVKELAKLKEKEGMVEEDYNLRLDDDIAEAKQAITEHSKTITKMRY